MRDRIDLKRNTRLNLAQEIADTAYIPALHYCAPQRRSRRSARGPPHPPAPSRGRWPCTGWLSKRHEPRKGRGQQQTPPRSAPVARGARGSDCPQRPAIACAQDRFGGTTYTCLYHRQNNLPMPRDSHMLQNVTPHSAPSQLHKHFGRHWSPEVMGVSNCQPNRQSAYLVMPSLEISAGTELISSRVAIRSMSADAASRLCLRQNTRILPRRRWLERRRSDVAYRWGQSWEGGGASPP